jgi:hypothetical protein
MQKDASIAEIGLASDRVDRVYFLFLVGSIKNACHINIPGHMISTERYRRTIVIA